MAALFCFFVFYLPLAFGFPSSSQVNQPNFEFSLSSDSVVSSQSIEQVCHFREHWDPCYAHCQHNCTNWGRKIPCPKMCVPGCVCDDGYVKGPNNECIPPVTCENLSEYFTNEEPQETSEEHECPTKEHWDLCSVHCQKTCINKDKPFPCPEICVPGCVCNSGYVRGIDGKCTLPRLCPSPDHGYRESFKMAFKCARNQHWDSCKAHCGRNCTNYDKPAPCPSICISGCICDAGYVWGPDGDCIPTSQCRLHSSSSSTENDEFCPPNEEFSRCLAHCQRNCSNWSDPTLPCKKICVPGCICKNGMVRGYHGSCIFLRQCPPRNVVGDISGEIECPVDEHFERCSAHCQKNCDNWNQTIPCPDICVSGCVCDALYVRSATGKCIPSQKCSSPKEVSNSEKENADICPEHEHRSMYNVLPQSKNLCVHDNYFIDYCPPTYMNGCICDKGLFRGLDNKCIDTRFLPNANELEFVHKTSSETEEEDDCHDIFDDQVRHISDIQFLSTESGEQETGDPVTYNQSPLTDSPDGPNDLHEGYETLRTKDDDGPLTSPPAVMPHQAERDSLLDDGCPDTNICNQQCKSSLHKFGHCIGKHYERCVCYRL